MKISNKLETIFAKIAKNQYKVHTFFKEWRVAVLISVFVKFLTMGVSLFAGFYWFKSIIYPLINNQFFTVFFSVLFLLSLEILTAVFLSKFFKFLLRKNFKTMLMPLFVAIGLFTISFISSTNGLSMRQSKQANQTETITDKYELQTIAINQKFENQILEIKKQISTIESNPLGWSGGKRTNLLDNQLSKIDSLYTVIALLNSNLKTELNEIETKQNKEISLNTVLMTDEAAKYYLIVAIIMFIQFVCNGLLMFFWAKIYEENEQGNYTTELVQQIGTEINDNNFKMMFGTFQKQFEMFITALGIESDKLQPKEITTITNEKTHVKDDKKSVEIPKPVTQIGFIKTVENKKSTNSTNENRKKTKYDNQRLCKYCGKSYEVKHHKQIYCSTECRLQWHKENKGFDLSKHLKYTKKNK